MPPEPHLGWCTAVDCADSGVHLSEPVVVGDPHEIVGIAAARIRIGDTTNGITLAVTQYGVTTTYTIPDSQAQSLTHVVGELLTV